VNPRRIILLITLFIFQSFVITLPSHAAACSTASTTLAGSGSSVDPYLIQSKDDLVYLSSTDSYWDTNKYFKQTVNIDLAGCEWTPIGSSLKNFKGSYDGNFKTISNLYFNSASSDKIGLFGVTASNSLSAETIKNLGLISVNLKANKNVGAFVGMDIGTGTTDYRYLFATGNLEAIGTSKDYFGGLIGEGSDYAAISHSYSRVNISRAVDSSAGLGGRFKSATKSYSTGSVPIASYNSGLSSSYASNSTSANTTGSVWDITTSGQTKETHASVSTANGKTTAQMKTLSTFTGLSWAITDGWAEFNTSTNIWGICSAVNDGYPFLQWQYTSSTIDSTCSGYVDPNPPVINSGGSSPTVSVTPTPSATATAKPKAKPSPSVTKPVIEIRNLISGSRSNPESLFKVLITEISDSLKPTVVNLFASNQGNLLDQNTALNLLPNTLDKKATDLPSLVTIGNTPQSSRIVIVDNSSAQVITAQGGVLAVEAKDGDTPIPVDNSGRVQMVKNNNVESQGSGLAPNTEFAVYLFSDPQLLGVGKTDAQGNFFASFPVENEIAVGEHTLQVKGLLKSGQTSSVSIPVSVVAALEATQDEAMTEEIVDKNTSSKFSFSWIFIVLILVIIVGVLTKRDRLLILIKRRKRAK
jgi:hypothetical protein